MLKRLSLEGVGPAKRMELDLGERLNLITGDNGLGKSFLLDIAWWALTRTWPRASALATPREDAQDAAIGASILSKNGKLVKRRSTFDFKKQLWSQPQARPPMPGLVIYAQVDGGFSVWDPARNYWKQEGEERPNAFLFDSRQVWAGLQEGGQWRCNGLYRDWASWQREAGSEAFTQLKRAIQELSPPNETLRPGTLQRIGPDDSQDYPTIQMPYGISVPVVHASAAIRRILALAYLLIWAWQEHLLAAKQRREDATHRIIFIIDEMEAHLHPAWQRRILPCIFKVVEALAASEPKPSIQLLATTHSPLVCVSMESFFDAAKDRLFDLDLDPMAGVKVEAADFSRLGSGENWLLSRHFDLKTSYSEEAEIALAEAGKLIEREQYSNGKVKKAEFLKLDGRLRKVLSDVDPYWVIWRRIGEAKRWLK